MGEQRPNLLSLGSLPGHPAASAKLASRHPSLSLDPCQALSLLFYEAPTPHSERPCVFFKLMQLRALKFANDRVFHFPFI